LRYQSLSTTTAATTTQAPSTGRPRSPVSPARASRNAEYESTGSEWEEALEKSLKNVLADGNPVLHLFTKRIYKVLLRAMLGQPYLAKLPSLSLHAKGIQRNMSELIARAVKLFTVHSGVYEEVYSMIFASYTFTHYVFPEAEIDVD
jgi:T-complex protein 11